MSSTEVVMPKLGKTQDLPANSPLGHDPESQLSPDVHAFLARQKRLYIGGMFVDAADRQTFETEDPALGIGITQIPSAGQRDIEAAATVAREAFEKRWRPLAPAQRASYLFKLADLINQHSEELGRSLRLIRESRPIRRRSGESASNG
jgi:acyl-CoA reductase-like NAD-dependent aldehyde dehydrogenase